VTKSKRSLVMASAALVAVVAQLFAFWRYLDRLPDDRIGLTLYVITIALFASTATLFFTRWRQSRQTGE